MVPLSKHGSHATSMVLPWCFPGAFMVLVWVHHESMVPMWEHHGGMVLVWASVVLQWCFYVDSMALPWCFHGASMVLPWCFRATPIEALRFHGTFMGLPWCLHSASKILTILCCFQDAYRHHICLWDYHGASIGLARDSHETMLLQGDSVVFHGMPIEACGAFIKLP